MNKQSSHMKNFTCSLIALFSAVLTFSSATAQQEPGKELKVVPAIAEGLSVHNLFQSNMVLQREKLITIWGMGSCKRRGDCIICWTDTDHKGWHRPVVEGHFSSDASVGRTNADDDQGKGCDPYARQHPDG
jgi:hypothetical protein